MKVMHCKEPWNSKVNFIDENNVALGYDMDQCCCEDADWFIADRICNEVHKRDDDNPDLTGYTFDTSFFKDGAECADLNAGGMAIFRITNGVQEKFIHLYNCQNGYYSHGFEFTYGGQSVTGSL